MTAVTRWRPVRRLATGLLLLAALPAVAAPGELGRAFTQAWARAPQAAGFDAREAQARAEREVAAGLIPEPGAVSVGSLNDRLDGKRGKQEYEVELALPLWLPGQRAARQAEAAQRGELVAAQRAATRLELAGELREAWWGLAQARSSARLAQRRIDTALALENDVLRRYAAGELSRIDANLARSETQVARAEAIETEGVLLQAEQTLRLLLGAPAPLELTEEEPTPPPAAAAVDDRLLEHPLHLAATASARAARAQVGVVEVSQRAAPELSLRVVRERGDYAEPYGNTVGMRLTLPFSSGPALRRDTAAAQAEALHGEVAAQRLHARLRLELERAARDLRAAESQLALAEERRHLASENLRLSEKAFALGESDLAGLLRIRAAAFDADAVLERQRVQRAAAISRLNQALGVLP